MINLCKDPSRVTPGLYISNIGCGLTPYREKPLVIVGHGSRGMPCHESYGPLLQEASHYKISARSQRCLQKQKVASYHYQFESFKPLPVYLDESASYHHYCLKCRKQYYLDNPKRHRVSSLNEGTIIKSQVKKTYRLSTAALDMVPSIITTNFIYRRSDLFRNVCEVHGGVVGLRSVGTIVGSRYNIAESE